MIFTIFTVGLCGGVRVKLIKAPILVLLSILLFLSLFLPSNIYGIDQEREAFPFQNHLGYVVIVSDLHYPYGGKNVENVFATIVKIKPKYVFILGDLTEMGSEEEFKNANKLVDMLEKEKINYERLLGNHDVRWAYNIWKSKSINGALYENFLIDLDDIAFIGVDTTLYFQHFGHIGDAQLRWLQGQISKYEKSLKEVVILSHHPFAGPANYTDDGWKLENIINTYNQKNVFTVVPLVLYGHVHTFGKSGLYNKTWYQSIGAAKDGFLTVLSWDKDNFYLWRTQVKMEVKIEVKKSVENYSYNKQNDQDLKFELVRTIQRRSKLSNSKNNQSNSSKVGSKENWIKEMFEYKMENSVFSKPVLFKDSLIVADYSGNIISLKINGKINKINWKVRLDKSIVANLDIWEDSIIVGDLEGNLYKLDFNSGKILSKVKLDSPIFSIKVGAETIVIGAGKNVYMLSRELKILASYATGGLVQSQANFTDNLFFQTSWGGKIYVLSEAGEIVKEFLSGTKYYTSGASTPAILGDYICVTNPFGGTQVFNYKDNENLEIRGLKSGYTSATPINAEIKEFLVCGIDGVISVLRIQEKEGKRRLSVESQVNIKSPIYGSAAQVMPRIQQLNSNENSGKNSEISSNSKSLSAIQKTIVLGTTKGELVVLNFDQEYSTLKLVLKEKLHNSYILLPILVENNYITVIFTDGTIKFFKINL